eukprot:2160803-Alexandrium_andersonii.AAC.1
MGGDQARGEDQRVVSEPRPLAQDAVGDDHRVEPEQQQLAHDEHVEVASPRRPRAGRWTRARPSAKPGTPSARSTRRSG